MEKRKGARMSNHGHKWTNSELKRVMVMWADGCDVSEIANSLNSTSYAISKIVVRLRQNGVPLQKRTRGHKANQQYQPWSQSDVEYLVRRRKQKATAEDIGIELGRTYNSVNAMIGVLRANKVGVEMLGAGSRRLWNPDILISKSVFEKLAG